MKIKELIRQLEAQNQEAEIKIRVDSKDKAGQITEKWFNIDAVNEETKTRTVTVDKIYPGCKIRVIGPTPYIAAKFSDSRKIN